jgi:hypothetical protein
MNLKKYLKNSFFKILAISLSVFCFSCNDNSNKSVVRKVVAEWTGKEIKFPAENQCLSIMKDTACIDLYRDNYKILLYVDSLGCTSCRTKLGEWKNLINQSDTVFNQKPDFLFFSTLN